MSLKYILKARKFPTEILVLEKRQTGLRIRNDRGRRMSNRTTNETTYHLMKSGKTTKPIPRESAVGTTQRGGDFVILYSPCDGSYYPLTFDEDLRKLIGVDEELRQWVTQDETMAVRKWQSKKDKLEKYLPIITLVVFALSFVIMAYGAWTYGMSQIVERFASVSGEMVEISKNLAQVGKQVVS